MAQNGLKLNSNTKKKANKQVEMFIFIKLNLFRKTTKNGGYLNERETLLKYGQLPKGIVFLSFS